MLSPKFIEKFKRSTRAYNVGWTISTASKKIFVTKKKKKKILLRSCIWALISHFIELSE